MKNIIVIQGLKNSGKDQVAKYISYLLNTPTWLHSYTVAKLLNFKPIKSNWKIIKYADSLKKMLAIMLNVNVGKFEDRDFKENYYFDFNTFTLLNKKNASSYYTITDKQMSRELNKNNLNIALEHILSVRQILQFFGTNIMRKFFGDKLWIYNTLSCNYNNIIIADQRFTIENDTINNLNNCNKYIIHITRPESIPGCHPSETELVTLLKNKKYSFLLENNGSLKDLFKKCKFIITKTKFNF